MPKGSSRKGIKMHREPTKYSLAFRDALRAKLEKYADATTIPILAEFTSQNHVTRTALYGWPEFADPIKRLLEKKEAELEKLMLSGTPNVTTGCIFSLKQLGWRDRQEVEHVGELKITVIYEDGKGEKNPG